MNWPDGWNGRSIGQCTDAVKARRLQRAVFDAESCD
jgi:hypothetical protein